MQSLFRQLSANPSVMQNLMSPENMQQFSNIFAQNPGIIQQVMNNLFTPFRINLFILKLLPSMPSIPGVSRSAMEQTVNMVRIML
jgi:hypothetical protein